MHGFAFLKGQPGCSIDSGGQETGVSQRDALKQVTDAGGLGSGDGNGDRVCVRIRKRTPEPAAALAGRGREVRHQVEELGEAKVWEGQRVLFAHAHFCSL